MYGRKYMLFPKVHFLIVLLSNYHQYQLGYVTFNMYPGYQEPIYAQYYSYTADGKRSSRLVKYGHYKTYSKQDLKFVFDNYNLPKFENITPSRTVCILPGQKRITE